MKKIIIFLLIALIMTSCFSLANADINSEILFRDTPWGTPATEFQTTMKKQKISGSIGEESYNYSWEFKPADGKIKPVFHLEDCGYYFSCYPKDLSVASFNVDKIEASFLFTHDENNVYTEKEGSALYKAKYVFDVAVAETAYSVLSTKLTTLYGTGTTGSNSAGWWSTGGDYHTFSEWTTWYGTEDTGVVLCYIYETYDDTNKLKNEELYLLYGKTNSVQMMDDLKAALAREEVEKALTSDDMSGL